MEADLEVVRKEYDAARLHFDELDAAQKKAGDKGATVVTETLSRPVMPAPLVEAFLRASEMSEKYHLIYHAVVSGWNVVQLKLLGNDFELFPMAQQCFNHVVHEVELRGGSADPVHYNFSFTICPFRSIVAQQMPLPNHNATAPLVIGYFQPLAELVSIYDANISTVDPLGLLQHLRTSWYDVTSEGGELIDVVRASVVHCQVVHRLHPTVTLYAGGTRCWMGGRRSATVALVCDVYDRVASVRENGICEYEVLLSTPSVCTEAMLNALDVLIRI